MVVVVTKLVVQSTPCGKMIIQETEKIIELLFMFICLIHECVCVCVHVHAHMHELSRIQLFATSWSEAHQAALSMEFSRQE